MIFQVKEIFKFILFYYIKVNVRNSNVSGRKVST